MSYAEQQLVIIRRIAERGLTKAQELADDSGASYYVNAGEYVDLFQHIIDEATRLDHAGTI